VLFKDPRKGDLLNKTVPPVNPGSGCVGGMQITDLGCGFVLFKDFKQDSSSC
jgi:hypothetical protein